MPCRHVLSRIALGFVLIMLPVLATAGAWVVPGKDAGRATPSGVPYLPAPVPCDQAVQDLTLTVAMQETYTDVTSGDGVIDSYACDSGSPLTGPEHIYVLTAAEDLIVDLWLASNVPADLDLVLLSDCDSDACLAQANTELSARLSAGATVYLVVDGYQGDAGQYTLHLVTRPVGIDDSICNGGAQLLDIVGNASQSDADSLNTRSNLVSVYDCAPYTVRGGEKWYAMTIAAADTDTVGIGYGEGLTVTVTATTTSLTLDLALWLFDGCGPDAACLAFVDAANAGGEEVLLWDNPDPVATTVYLAVDCIRPPADGVEGAYSLAVDSVLPVETQSVTNVRKLFR